MRTKRRVKEIGEQIRDIRREKSNISLEEYLQILSEVKEAALRDLEHFPENERWPEGKKGNSFLGVKLRYRDDEDCLYADGQVKYELFTRWKPDLWDYLGRESEWIFEDGELFTEPVEKKFYWEVIKYIELQGRVCEQYAVTFSLKREILSVQAMLWEFESLSSRFPESLKCLSEEQKFILNHGRQLHEPMNVMLPYQPGDILHIDAEPFGKSFDVVYRAQTMADREHFEWTFREYGYYKREHPCLYLSEDQQGLAATDLCGQFTDYISFPWAPLDRIRLVESCENPELREAAYLLKKGGHAAGEMLLNHIDCWYNIENDSK